MLDWSVSFLILNDLWACLDALFLLLIEGSAARARFTEGAWRQREIISKGLVTSFASRLPRAHTHFERKHLSS